MPKLNSYIRTSRIETCITQYCWLRRIGFLEQHSVIIYEAREAPAAANLETSNASVIGVSIKLISTELHVLRRLDQDLYDEILRTGHIIRSKRISNARGWTLSNLPVGGEDEKTGMIRRDACCQLLRKRVLDDAIVRRKVTDVKLAGNNKPRLVFQDQTMEEFDFAIVCNGIWSWVRRPKFGDQDHDQYDFSLKYEGLIGMSGFIPSSKIQDTPDGEMNVILGANGFFGYGATPKTPLELVPRRHRGQLIRQTSVRMIGETLMKQR
ncbi:hypothetical protein FHL15_007344 [Xylaria flabelliformis]|uniref:FAD dependent oxidoreductase domain-containing protein n=1 Tax=Xylaria flabelliformis TaxID=2512241 RepID=A0A553HV10_9PEZI|nr:hypothetical protein FHL15_007344 [Xylaria flabelliformis]